MRTFTFLLIISLIAAPILNLFSQTPEAKVPARAAYNINHDNSMPEDGIVAAFSADVRSG